jgi:excisionase family DNA binding protein
MPMVAQEVGRGNDNQLQYTPAQAAARLGISEVALRSWIFRNKIGARRIGRRVFIPATELHRLAERP